MHSLHGYKGRLRVRVCGILTDDKKVLLVQIHSPVTGRSVWMPPGGQLEFGESVEECLQREFQEETSLKVRVKSFQFINELIEPPFHALELYYSVQKISGEAMLGNDPEIDSEHQLLKDLQWIPKNKLKKIQIVPKQLLNYLH